MTNGDLPSRPLPAVPADQDAFCTHCQYNLRGLTEPRCPECGRPFDPANLHTSLIPWVNRKQIGRVRAFFKTAWQASIRPRKTLLGEGTYAGTFRDAAVPLVDLAIPIHWPFRYRLPNGWDPGQL